MANAITYIKNVGKSVGYASFDVIKGMNPVFSDFAETNGELATDMYKSIRNLKNKSKDIPNKIMESEYGKFGKTYLDNLFSDIKTGKLYNKERKSKYESEAAEVMMGMDGDFSFDDDFNFDDMGSFDDDEPSTNDMLDIVGEKTSNSINTTLARTAEYIVEGTTASNKAIYNQINNIYGGLHTGLATINQNISKMIEFHNEGTMTHYENSRTFFQESTRLDQERNMYLKEISESLKQLNEPATNQKSTKTEYRKNTYSDMVTYEGVLDISRYGQNIKKNIKDKSGGIFDMLNMMIETGMLNTLAASPLEGLAKMMVASVIPNAVEKSMENLNKSLSGMVGNALLGMKNKAKESSVWEVISEIFGVNTGIQTKLDTSKYEKGKIPFDGVTKKAIVEVIPTYLAKILSAVSGSKENRFDYENGKFVTIDQMRSDYDNLAKTSANRAAYGIDSVVRSKTRKLGWDDNRQRQFDEDWEVIKEYMFRHQKNFNTRDKKLRGSSFGLKGELADENVRLLQKILDGNPEMLRYADQLFKEIDTHNRRMVDLQNSGSMTAIENGSIKEPKTPASGTSPYAFASASNGTILSELVAIHKELSYIRVYGSGRAGGSKKGKGGPKPSFDKFSIPEPRLGNVNQYDKEVNKNASDHYENLSDEELDERTARILATAKDETIVDSDRKTFSERMHEASTFSAKMSVLVKSASELAKKPGEFVVAMMDKADARLYDLIYGPKEDKEGKKSFIGRLFKGLEGMFDKFSDFVTDTIIEPLKGKFSKENVHEAAKKFFGIFGIDLDKSIAAVKETLFGKKDAEGNRTKNGLFGKFIDSFKSEMSGAFKWVKNAFKGVGDWTGVTSKKKDKPSAVDTIISGISNTTEAASGIKRVNKTGLAVISEGEMILPPDMNPFNVSKRKRNEKQFKRDLISSIANADEYAEGKDENGKKFNREEYERLPFWVRMSDTFMEGSTKFFENLSQNIGLNKESTDKFKDNAVDFIGKIKEYGGTMAAGATIGAGVSVLTGLIGGPLVGAAVGAGVGLIKKSETVQNMLFGELKDGERQGGLISKELSNNISKYLPDMAKGATVGGILTALPIVPGGPIAGVILGSALGFAKNNEKVQESLFGEGKLLGTKENFKKKVQSVLPKMGVGALAGLLAGPFGLTTNLVLGSALGFASDTNAFKDLMFGEEEDGVREGGILGAITKPTKEFFDKMYAEFKEFVYKDMVQPVANAIKPITKQFEIMGKSVTNTIGELLKNIFVRGTGSLFRSISEKIISPLTKMVEWAINPLKAIISAPSKLIGAVGDSLRKRQIKRGQADYMSAQQRNAFRRSRGKLMGPGDKYSEFDQTLEGLSYEDLDVIQNSLQGVKNSNRSITSLNDKSYSVIKKQMYSNKNKLDTDTAKIALSMVRHGSYDEAIKLVRDNNNIDEASKTRILTTLSKESAKLKIAEQMKENSSGAKAELAKSFKKLGLNLPPETIDKLVKGDKEAIKIYEMITAEKKYRDKSKTSETPAEKSEEDKRHNEIIDHIKEITGLLKEQLNIESEVYKKDLSRQETHYDIMGGLQEDEDGSYDDLNEETTIGDKIRLSRYNFKKSRKNLTNQITGQIKRGHQSVKKTVSKVRYSDPMVSLIGDGNDEWMNKVNPKSKTVTHITADGHPLTYDVEDDGTYSLKEGDSNNKEFQKEQSEKKEREKGILGALTNMPTTFGSIFGKIFKKDEEEETIFEKIWKFLTGDSSKFSLMTVLMSALPIATLFAGLTGSLDNIASLISGGGLGKKGSNDTLTVTDENGNKVQVKTDKKGNPVKDKNGNYVTVDGKTVSSNAYLNTNKSLATMPLSERLAYNTVRGTVTRTGSIAGSVIKSNKLINNRATKTASKGILSATKIIKETATDSSVLRGVMDQVIDCIDKWTSAIKKVPMLQKYASNIDELGLKIGILIEDNLPRAGKALSGVSKTLSKLAWPILIASVVIDFTTGMQDASTTLKINEEDVTLPHKIVCGLVRTVKNFIPIIGTFIPDSVVTDLFINYVASWFGISIGELKGKREEAKAELDTYNKEKGTNLTWSEYNKQVEGNYTWTEKIQNKMSSFKTNVKEKGLVGTISSGLGISKASEWVSDKATGAKNWVVDKAGKVKDSVSFAVDSARTAVNEKLDLFKDIGSYAKDVVKDTWKEFITGKEKNSESLKIDKNDPHADHKKVVYNTVKIATFLPVQLSKLARSLWKEAEPAVNGVKTIGTGLAEAVKSQFVNAWNGDIYKVFNTSEGYAKTGNSFIDGTSGVINTTAKLALAVPTLLTAGIGLVVRNVEPVVEGVKTIGSGLADAVKAQFTNAWNGDIDKVFNTNEGYANTGNNLVDTISGVTNTTAKMTLAIPTLLTAGIGLVVRNIEPVIDGIKTIGRGIADSVKAQFTNAWNGDIDKVFNDSTGYANTGNPLVDSISGMINTLVKMTLAIPTLLVSVVGKVKNFFSIDNLKNLGNNILTTLGINDEETGMGSGIAGRGSGLYIGRGSAENKHFIKTVKNSRNEESKYNNELARNTFISQIDSKYKDQKFNISGDTETQTLGDTGCAPAAAAMAINSSLGNNQATMEDSSRFALKYKVKNDGVNATYFNDEFARHGINAKYITSSNAQIRSNEIMRQLAGNNRVVLMGEDHSNTTKANSPFGPNAHYVVANGLSEDGKYIYINDPESKVPNLKYPTDKVLASSKLGIAANVARGSNLITNKLKKFVGRGKYGPETIQYKVWNGLRAAGYSEIATAAAMGNIKHESGFNPSAIEKGSGAGFGLIQWTGDRRTAIENYARSKGVSASDINLQIEYLIKELAVGSGQWSTKASPKYGFGPLTRNDWANGNDIDKATKAFMCCFERPSYSSSVNHIDRRMESAREFYKEFTGTAISPSSSTYIPNVSGSTLLNNNPLSEILGVFSGLSQAYGLLPTGTSDISNSTDVSAVVPGIATGNVSSNPAFAEQQRSLVNKMYSVQGKLKYAQDNAKYPGSRNPEDGSGDCSSTVQWAYQKVLGVDPGSWTGAQRTDPDTYTVATNNWTEANLQLGDLLLKDGHVEMYAGNGQMIGHGSGYGPKVKKLGSPSTYSLVRRWKGFQGAGSGLTDYVGKGSEASNGAYNNALRNIKSEEFASMLPLGYDNEEIAQNKISVMQYSKNKLNDTQKINKTAQYVGRASNVSTDVKVVEKPNTDMITLVKAMLKLLVQLVTNTDQLNNIAKLLGDYITTASSSDGSKESKEATVLAKQNLINAMQSGGNNNSKPNAQLLALIEATERIARE